MPLQVVNGAQMMCSFGNAPSVLTVLPVRMVNCANQPAATVMDYVPMVNIKPFGMCIAPANPTFIAATAAKLGVPTPVPCVPATAAPWVPGGVTVNNTMQVTLDQPSKCLCTWLGIITISNPGQTATQVP